MTYHAPLVQPFPYQIVGAEWMASKDHALLADVPGVGKTATAIRAADLAGASNILVVCPASTRIQWGREFERFSPLDRPMQVCMPGDTPNTSGVVILFYDQVVKHLELLMSVQWDVLILDEAHYCFPYDVEVQTKNGPKLIGEICEDAREEYVLCCDLSKDTLEYRKVTGRIKTPLYTDFIEVVHEHGKFVCTADHQVWTTRGYVQASQISKADSVRFLRKDMFGGVEGESDTEMLLKTMLDEAAFFRSKSEREIFQNSNEAPSTEDLRMVREPIFCPELSKGHSEVLRPTLCGFMADESPWSCRSGGEEDARSTELMAREKTSRLGGEDARKQSDEGLSSSPKNGGRLARKAVPNETGWKREFFYSSNTAGRGDRAGKGVQSQHGKSARALPQDTKHIRLGSGASREESGSGVGRPFAQLSTHTGSGQKERSGFIESRVVSVEIQKRGCNDELGGDCRRDTFVYCLEVEEHHNFFANGVLVSNCKERYKVGKKTSGYRTKAIYGFGKRFPGLITKATRTWRLTGTPAPNHAGELWTHVKSAGLTDLPYWDWVYKFCEGFDAEHGFRFTKHKNIPELQAILAPFMLRRTKAEVQPNLKEPMFETITVPRSDAAMAPEFLTMIPQIAQADEQLQEALSSGDPDAQLQILESMASSLASLRRYTLMSKLPAIAEQIIEDLTAGGIQKLTIFGIHKIGIKWLAEKLKPFGPVVIDGDTPAAKRQPNIDRFQRDPNCRAILGNIAAMGTGVDGLQNVCDEAIFCEQDWVPSSNAQAIMRLCRIGQKNPVRARIFSLYGSVDERVQDVLTAKVRELAKIL